VRIRLFIRISLLVLIGFTCLWQIGYQAWMSAHDLTIAMPFLVSRGMYMFRDVFSFHAPLSTWFLATIYRYADPVTSLRILNLIFILITAALIFRVGRRLRGPAHAWAGVLFYFLWASLYNTMPFYVDGLVGTFAVLVLLLATNPPSTAVLLTIGLAAGIGASLKQNAFLLLIVPLGWFLWTMRKDLRTAFKQMGTILVAEIAVLLAQVGILLFSGDLNMAIRALFNPGNSFLLADFTSTLFSDGGAWRAIALTMAFIPAYLLLFLRERTSIGFLTLLLSGATVVLNFPTPGYYHMMACLPMVALMSGTVLGTWIEELRRSMSLGDWKQMLERASVSGLMLTGITAGIILASMVTALTPVFGLIQTGVHLVGWDELRPVSTWVTEHTSANQRILILPVYDTNANIYAQSDRLPPIYMKTWYQHASVPENIDLIQERVLAEPPALIVFFPDLFIPVEPYFTDLQAYIETHYEEVGRMDDVPFQGDVIFLSRVDS
jgi:hypothetical protein